MTTLLHRKIFSFRPLSLLFMSLVTAVSLASGAEVPFFHQVEALDLSPVARSADEQKAEELMWLRRGSMITGNSAYSKPVAGQFQVPADGTYYVWARYQTSPIRRRTFSIILNGQSLVYCLLPYGETPDERPDIYEGTTADEKGVIWTVQEAELKAGEVEFTLSARPEPPFGGRFTGGTHAPVVSRILITSDPTHRPENK
jgi:hypothetical protein